MRSAEAASIVTALAIRWSVVAGLCQKAWRAKTHASVRMATSCPLFQLGPMFGGLAPIQDSRIRQNASA